MDERERRHAKQFEPPPWEQAAFDEFQRLKTEREQEAALQEALKAAMAPADVIVAEAEPDTEAPTIGPERVIESDIVLSVETEAAKKPEAGEPGVSSAALEAMLIGLRSQEPKVTKNYKLIANVASAFLMGGGLGFVVWAAVVFAKVGPSGGSTPTLASLLLMVWGFLLMSGAGLLFKKYNLT